MAVRLPLDRYSFSSRKFDILVDLADENGGVTLSIEIEAGEGLAYSRSTPADIDALLEEAGTALELRLRDEILDLRRQLEPTADISRDLLPSEARSLAAMLMHFANEADR